MRARRHDILDARLPLLVHQVQSARLSLVIVNGAAVWNEMTRVGLLHPVDAGQFRFGHRSESARLLTAHALGTTFAGWTLNVQSSHGVRSADRERLADWLRGVAVPHG